MQLGIVPSSNITQSALMAYVHYLSFMLCFGALVFERISLKVDPDRTLAISMVIADLIYGFAGIALLLSGIFRVRYFGQGGDFYTHNPIFWIKISIFIVIGLISLYPTFTYILWAIPLSKGKLPDVSFNLVSRLKILINIELIGFCLIPLFASFMARGIGLNY
tara:strand:- start:1092 stop:1580 length:489 start_codon:yes stop_codon:yes gene_type:complete